MLVLKAKLSGPYDMQSGTDHELDPYLWDSTVILPFGALQSFQVMAGTVIVHKLPAAFGDAILPTGKQKALRQGQSHEFPLMD